MEISTSSISKNANEFESYRSELQTACNNIKASIEKLEGTWEGESATKFFNATKGTYLPELEKAIESLSNYSSFLSEVPNVYGTLDSSYSQRKIDV
ncbi:MAG: WXG100 family type VII secretion target [Bacilli bacterium]|nr:WXG100 family type VII secretion target [Bacilli bacterium]